MARSQYTATTVTGLLVTCLSCAFLIVYACSTNAAAAMSTEVTHGQAISLSVEAPDARVVRFMLAGQEQLDGKPPFMASFDTDSMPPGKYRIVTFLYAGAGSERLTGAPSWCVSLGCVGYADLRGYCRSLGWQRFFYESKGFDAAYGSSCAGTGRRTYALLPSRITDACNWQYGGGDTAGFVGAAFDSEFPAWYCYPVAPSVGGGSAEAAVYPIMSVPEFKASALIVSGTRRIVGLHLTGVATDSVVRAWINTSAVDEYRIPLRLKRKVGKSRTYRFSRGQTLSVSKNSLIDVEVAPPPGTISHGAEVQGRISMIWLRQDSAGRTLAHQSEHSYCTVGGRREPGTKYPLRRGNCMQAPTLPATPTFQVSG